MRKVRWGIIGTADIGVNRVIPAMQRGEYCEIVALASRTGEKAQQAARQLGIPRAYGSYEELLADPTVEAVYNPLPNHLHIPWTLKALEAGKHVLCEKPLALTIEQARELIAAMEMAPHLKVMEAFMYRLHPQWQRARQLIKEGKIGTLRTVQTFFSYYLDDPKNIRNDPAAGGGGMWDIGCYAVSVARFIFGAEPRRVFGSIENDPRFKIDRLASGILDFGEAGTATFTCGTQLAPYQRVNIFGTTGRIEIEIPFNSPQDRPCKIWLQQGEEIEEIELPATDQYTQQGDLFSRAILDDTAVPTPLEDAFANLRTIEAIFQSAKSGSWV